jgi:hypothetical protein
MPDARQRRAAARQSFAQGRAAPLMIRVLRREREDAVALAPRRVRLAVERDRARRRRQHAGEQLNSVVLPAPFDPVRRQAPGLSVMLALQRSRRLRIGE